MAHHRYQTQALVLGATPLGEANRFIDLFTKEFGRVRAVARSVREERSKLRFALQDFSLSDVSLVRGRDVWRVVGAQSVSNFYTDLSHTEEGQALMIRLLSLLRRLLNGEEQNVELFTTVLSSLTFIRDIKQSPEELHNLECLTVLRVLYNLGYLAKDTHNADFLETYEVTTDLVTRLSPIRLSVIKQINTSLEESQL